MMEFLGYGLTIWVSICGMRVGVVGQGMYCKLRFMRYDSIMVRSHAYAKAMVPGAYSRPRERRQARSR